MRRIIIILSLLAVVTQGSGQWVKKLNTFNGVPIAWGIHVPSANPSGAKHPLIIYLHGIDLRGPGGDTVSSSGIVRVVTKGIPSYITSAPMPYFTRPGTTDQYRFAVAFPQCPSSYGQWQNWMIDGVIAQVKANYSSVIDTNRITLVGFSLGGGGVFGYLASSGRNQLNYWIALAPGYDNGGTNRQDQADENPPGTIFHQYQDALAAIWRSDTFCNRTNRYKPVHPIQFIRIAQNIGGTNKHDIWPMIEVRSLTSGYPGYALTNGDTWVMKETIYETMLRYTKQRYKR